MIEPTNLGRPRSQETRCIHKEGGDSTVTLKGFISFPDAVAAETATDRKWVACSLEMNVRICRLPPLPPFPPASLFLFLRAALKIPCHAFTLHHRKRRNICYKQLILGWRKIEANMSSF